MICRSKLFAWIEQLDLYASFLEFFFVCYAFYRNSWLWSFRTFCLSVKPSCCLSVLVALLESVLLGVITMLTMSAATSIYLEGMHYFH